MYLDGGTLIGMPTALPRIQVTVDEELARALDTVDPSPASRSALVRDLALRGAQALESDRGRLTEARQLLCEIADGTVDVDLETSAALLAARDDRLP